MTTDQTDNGWDSLAEEFGLESGQEPGRPEKSAAPDERPASRPAPKRPARDPRPEIEQEADDFGSGLVGEAPPDRAPLYDPGPDAVEEDVDDFGAAPEPLDDAEAEDAPATGEPAGEGQEGGKKRRRRRRRRKKGGGGAAEPAGAEPEVEEGTEETPEDGGVEEGEAPAEVEGDEDEEAPPSAVDEEMDAEAALPRNEWHVMTWNELVSKLYRPG
jgi:ribonuclease E